MIIKGGSRSNGAFFAAHLLRTDTNERVHVIETRGFVADDIEGAFQEMAGVARGTRCKNSFYIVSLNPTADEQLSTEEWEQAADILERHLGLDGQARLVVEHEKGDGRIHRHIAWSRIDLDSMTAISDSLTYPKHERAARDIEQAFGLEPVESVLVKDREGERPERRPRDYEGHRAQDTGIDPQKMRAEITALWQEADSGLSFKAALEDAGYILAKGDRRDFCIIDPAGDEHSLARRISGVKAAELRARLSDIDRDALPSVAEAREFAGAAGDEPVSEQPGERRERGEPENPGERRPQGEPTLPGANRPASAESGDLVRTHADDGAPERVSPWGNAWRVFSDKAAHYAEEIYAYWKDESSGARSVSPEPDGEPHPAPGSHPLSGSRSWMSRAMETGGHGLHGWRHGDSKELREAAELARGGILHPKSDPPPDDSRDMARPGGNVEPPAPDARPQGTLHGGSAGDKASEAPPAAPLSGTTGQTLSDLERIFADASESVRTPTLSPFERFAASLDADAAKTNGQSAPDAAPSVEPEGHDPELD